jgi:hypothetical protein
VTEYVNFEEARLCRTGCDLGEVTWVRLRGARGEAGIGLGEVWLMREIRRR